MHLHANGSRWQHAVGLCTVLLVDGGGGGGDDDLDQVLRGRGDLAVVGVPVRVYHRKPRQRVRRQRVLPHLRKVGPETPGHSHSTAATQLSTTTHPLQHGDERFGVLSPDGDTVSDHNNTPCTTATRL